MKHSYKCVGGLILSFGIGMLLSSFFPPHILIVIESVVIVSAGFILLK